MWKKEWLVSMSTPNSLTAFKMCVHHKLCTMHVEMLHVARNEATVHCVLLNQWARVVSKPSSSIRH